MITSMNFHAKSGKQISILDLIVNRQFTTLIKTTTTTSSPETFAHYEM